MDRNRIIYERVTVLDDILEIAIPKMFNMVVLTDDNKQNHIVWIKDNNESIYLCQLELNQYPLREIMEAARLQMVAENQQIKNLGVYSCESYGIDKFMSEDEIVGDETRMYIISCVLRYKDRSFLIYYTGNVFSKSSIKESMLYMLDSIKLNIKG